MILQWTHSSPFIFLLAFIFLLPLGVPGFVFVTLAVQMWSPGISLLMSLSGGFLGSLLGFVLARFLARNWLRQRIPKRFEKIHFLFEKGSFQAALNGHLLFYMAPPLAWGFGLSGIPIKEFALGCILGILPGTVLIVSMHGWALEWSQGRPLMSFILNLILAVPCLILVNLLMRYKMKKNSMGKVNSQKKE